MSLAMSNAVTKQHAILGGPPVRTDPFSPWPVARPWMMESLQEVLDSGEWGVGSPYVDAHLIPSASFFRNSNSFLSDPNIWLIILVAFW